MRKILILLAAASVVAVGCGGSSNTSASTPVKLSRNTTNKGTKDITGTTVEVEIDDFYFNPTFLKGGTPGSTITVTVKNDGKQLHTFTSTALGVDKQVAPGTTETVQVTLPQSGATEFHCRFHQQTNGMQGAFFFKDGDTLAGGSAPTVSSSSSDTGGYGYN